MFTLRSVYKLVFAFALFLFSFQAFAQSEKVVHQYTHFWISTNNTYRFTNRWGLLTDLHIRRNNFLKDPNFYFARAGAQFWINEKMKVAAGYAHLWLASNELGWDNYLNENRVYQQFSFSQSFSKANTYFRVRNEQRFFNNVKNGQRLGDSYMTNRVRVLLSLGIPFSPGSTTQFYLADEIHVQFGEHIVYNTFEQNRLTIGIKQKLTRNWSFDTGYMMVYQQKANGYTYALNHTFRLFFYGNFDFRKEN